MSLFLIVAVETHDDPISSRIKSLLPAALDTWKSRLEFYFQTYASGSAKLSFWSSLSLHFAAHLALHTDLIDLQIYAGATTLRGRRITRADRVKAQRCVKEWALGNQAANGTSGSMENEATGGNGIAKGQIVAWHAIVFLRSCLLKLLYSGNRAESAASKSVDNDSVPAASSPQRQECHSTQPHQHMYSSGSQTSQSTSSRPITYEAPHHDRCVFLAALATWAYCNAAAGRPSVVPRTTPHTHRRAFQPQELERDRAEVLRYCDRVCIGRPEDMAKLASWEQAVRLVKIVGDLLKDSRWEICAYACGLTINDYR